MNTTTFPTSLFDFDFTAEELPIGKDYDSAEELLALRKRHAERLSPTPTDNPLAPRTEDPEELQERLSALRDMAERALHEERMQAYFRLLDSIDAYEACIVAEPKPRPSNHGIPEVKLTYINDIENKPKISGSKDSADYFRATFDKGEIGYREFFKVGYLNRQNKLLGVQTVSVGGLDSCLIDKRVIFTGALLAGATSIIICHNHPSGNLLSSPQDDKITRDIKEAGKLLSIPLLDHIILTPHCYYSYADNGKIY